MSDDRIFDLSQFTDLAAYVDFPSTNSLVEKNIVKIERQESLLFDIIASNDKQLAFVLESKGYPPYRQTTSKQWLQSAV